MPVSRASLSSLLLGVLLLPACLNASEISSSRAGDMHILAKPAQLEAQGASEGASRTAAQVEPGALLRKRIREVTLYITTDQPGVARGTVEKLVVNARGYVEAVDVGGRGVAAPVVLTVRLPEQTLDAMLARIRDLGRVESEEQKSRDVTQQVIDTDAHLRNLQRTEERLLALLSQQSAALADVLAVESELTRVRGEIEQLTSQLKALEHDVAMAKVTVRLYREAPLDLAMPDDAWAPMRRLWREGAAVVSQSAAALVWLIAALARALLALLPWVPVLLISWLAWRRWRKRKDG